MLNKESFKIIFVNISLLASFFLTGELIARAYLPEFKGDIFSTNISRSKKIYKGNLFNIQLGRIPFKDHELNLTKNLFIVTGGSITNGYGLAYEDIYWSRMNRLYELLENDSMTFINISSYGMQLDDLPISDLLSVSKTFNSGNKYLLYQFSHSDISPPHARVPSVEIIPPNFFKKSYSFWRRFRFEYLNRSVFFRVLVHYGGVSKRASQTQLSCHQRGYDSLGAYTWSYGSEPFQADAEKYWNLFEEKLQGLIELSNKIESKLFVFISPLIFEVDLKGYHPFYNTFGLDFSCATIEPRDRLKELSVKYNFKFIDPTLYLRDGFESRVNEKNFTRFYFVDDDEHLTPTASMYLSEYLYSNIFDD